MRHKYFSAWHMETIWTPYEADEEPATRRIRCMSFVGSI